MKKHILDHLDDAEFAKRIDQLYDQLSNALNGVLDDWVKNGVIDDKEKNMMLDEWDEDKWHLFERVLG